MIIPIIILLVLGFIIWNLVQSILSNLWLVTAIVLLIAWFLVDKIAFFSKIKQKILK